MTDESEKSPLIVLAVIIISLLAYNFLILRDQRNTAAETASSLHNLPESFDKVEQQPIPPSLQDTGSKNKGAPQSANNE